MFLCSSELDADAWTATCSLLQCCLRRGGCTDRLQSGWEEAWWAHRAATAAAGRLLLHAWGPAQEHGFAEVLLLHMVRVHTLGSVGGGASPSVCAADVLVFVCTFWVRTQVRTRRR